MKAKLYGLPTTALPVAGLARQPRVNTGDFDGDADTSRGMILRREASELAMNHYCVFGIEEHQLLGGPVRRGLG